AGALGTMAMAWTAIMPAFILADVGLGLTLVQREEIGPDEIKFCFWVQSLCGALLAAALCVLAPLIAAFFEAPQLTDVLIVLSSVILVRAAGQVAVNLLRRSIDFRRLQIIQLAALLGSQLLCALPLALLGAGLWSLVAAAVANTVITTAAAYAITRHELGLAFSRK